MAIAFLCTRVKSPGGWLKETIESNSILKGPTAHSIDNWTNDPDMKSNMGIFMSIGKGGKYMSSCKKKLHTKSSTVAKLVAIDDAMAPTRHLLAAQGVHVPMENGSMSSS